MFLYFVNRDCHSCKEGRLLIFFFFRVHLVRILLWAALTFKMLILFCVELEKINYVSNGLPQIRDLSQRLLKKKIDILTLRRQINNNN